MTGDGRDMVRSQSLSKSPPVRGLNDLERYLSLVGLSSQQILEEDLSVSSKDVRGADSGSICSSMTRPLSDSPTNNLEREKKLGIIRKTLAKVSSITTSSQSLKGRSFPDGNCQGIEPDLCQPTRDTDPESLSPHKKPFCQRTWFACIVYGTLLALLVAAILALACTRSVIMPRSVLHGEASDNTIPQAKPISSYLQQEQSPSNLTTPVPTTDTTSSLGPPPLKGISDNSTVQQYQYQRMDPTTTLHPEVETSSQQIDTDVPTQITSLAVEQSPVIRQREVTVSLVLSLPGPLRRFLPI